jgi:hypothetical protein
MRVVWDSREKFLDAPGVTRAGSPQVEIAIERIRSDRAIAAVYGFSGGGYNARLSKRAFARS